jgi:hypothetical protein
MNSIFQTSDEELARALQNAINSGQEHYNPEELDRQLAAQLQQEEFRFVD